MSNAENQRTRFRPLLWRLVHSGILSAGMSALVALVVSAINTGIDPGLVQRWLIAWCIAFPVAWIAAFFWGPAARWLATRITPPPSRS
ncbi:MAG: DUF2798 domain-containing protein [Pseudomonadota bacterium]